MFIIPKELKKAVLKLKIKDESDKRVLKQTLEKEEYNSDRAICWLAALVARDGVKYNDRIEEHRKPHTWPLNG